MPRPFSDDVKSSACALYAAGQSFAVVGRALNISEAAVAKFVHAANGAVRRQGGPVLDPKSPVFLRARTLYDTGLTFKHIGELLGVNASTARAYFDRAKGERRTTSLSSREMVTIYRGGGTAAGIGQLAGIGAAAVAKRLKKEGCSLRGAIKVRPVLDQPIDLTVRHIALTVGQIAVVDADIYAWLMTWNWSAKWNKTNSSFYAQRAWVATDHGPRRIVLMHHAVVGAMDGFVIDHQDRDTLNNRRGNLRLATRSQNAANSKARSTNRSGLKGAHIRPDGRTWSSSIRVGGKRMYLGTFQNAEAAHQAYRSASMKHFGAFSRSE